MIRKYFFNIVSSLALILTLGMVFVSWSTVTHLERIDGRLEGITSELTRLGDPTYQQQQFNEKLSRVLDEVRRRQEIAMARSE